MPNELTSTVRPDVLAWLLDSDPAIRWQVLRDLTNAPAEQVNAERVRVAREGWGAKLLGMQRSDGQWGDGQENPFWWTNLYTLVYLRDFGIDPTSEPSRAAIDRVREHVTWGEEFNHSAFFNGEVEPCINGRALALGAYFGVRSDALLNRLLGEQLTDGGWNCEAERGSVRSSFDTTLCVLEGLLAFEDAFGTATRVRAAREQAHEYLLARGLLRRLSTREIINVRYADFAYPPLWHYDVLRALDYFRASGVRRDARMHEALALVLEKQTSDGKWHRDVRHRRTLYDDIFADVGEPDKWVTLRALRVLRWFDQSDGTN